MRLDQTASTLWTTNSSCTTKQTTLTTGASSASSTGNLTIVCWSDRVVLRGMQIQERPSLPATHGVVTTSFTIWHHRPTQLEMTFPQWSSCIPQTVRTTCGFGKKKKKKKRSLSPAPHSTSRNWRIVLSSCFRMSFCFATFVVLLPAPTTFCPVLWDF